MTREMMVSIGEALQGVFKSFPGVKLDEPVNIPRCGTMSINQAVEHLCNGTEIGERLAEAWVAGVAAEMGAKFFAMRLAKKAVGS